MSNYANLKSAIQSAIKTNGNNEITGQLLQTELLAMITTLGYGYQFMGVASPDTVPGTPDAKVFYIAYTPGTYTNFGGIAVTGLCVLKYATGWVKEDIPVTGGGTEFTVETTDLTLESGTPNKLKFADRIRNTNITSGKNYIIVRDVAQLKNNLANIGNAIYEIRYDFDLGGDSVTIAGGVTLLFNGGSVTNGSLVGNNTVIDGFGQKYFIGSIAFSGTWKNNVVSSEWFISSIVNLATIIPSLLVLVDAGGTIEIKRNTTLNDADAPINIGKSVNLNFYNTTLQLAARALDTTLVKRVFIIEAQDAAIRGISIKNLNIQATANIEEQDTFTGMTSFWGFLAASNVDGVVLENINGVHLHEGFKFAYNVGDDLGRKNILVKDCSLQGKMMVMFFGTENAVVENCTLDCSDATSALDHCLYITKTKNVTVQNCLFKNALDAINLFNSASGATYNDIENPILLNNTFDNCKRAFAMKYARNAIINGLVCKNRPTAATNFIWVTHSENVIISNWYAEQTETGNDLGVDVAYGKGTIVFKDCNVSAFYMPFGLSTCTMDVIIEDCQFKYTGANGDYANYAVMLQTAATFKNRITVKRCVFDFGQCNQGQYFFLNGDNSVGNIYKFIDCTFKRANTTSRLLFDQLNRLAANLFVENCIIDTTFNIGAVTNSSPKYKNCKRTTGTGIADQPFYNAESTTNIDSGLTPLLGTADSGRMVFDTTRNKVILWNGSAWVNLDGTALT